MKYILTTLSLIFILGSSAYASADITAVVKSTAINSVVITVKNTGPAGIDTSGSNRSTVSTKFTALNVTTNTVDYEFAGPSLAGGQSNDATISNLAPNTSYTITVTAEEGVTKRTTELRATTKQSPDQNLPPLPLYVSFVPSATIVTADTINNITVKNTGTKTFNATVTLKTPAGGVVATQTRLVGPGLSYNLFVFSNLTPNTTYSMTLSGTEQGSNRRFQTAIYPGAIVTKNVPPPQGDATGTAAQPPKQEGTKDQCHDLKDNQIGDGRNYGYGDGAGDNKADHFGVDSQIGDGKDYGLGINKGDGVIDIEPDPSCFSETATTEVGDDVVSTIIPCTDKCTLSDVFRLLNNAITFFFKTLMIPIFIIMLMYAGFKYITAEGNPGKIANLKKMLFNVVKGIVFILCSWLIVRTIMTTVLNDEYKQSGIELLEN